MNLYIDINSRTAVNGIGVASPLPPITFKDQDTPAVNIYFVLEGVVQDEGPGTAIKFGLNLPPPAAISLLVYDTSFTKLTDVNGNVFYQGFPVFYTSQLTAALGSSTSIACVGEVRTQLSDGEIWRTMDIPFTIWRTILLETTTPPPSIITVYPDASTLEIIPHKGVANGYAPLDGSSLVPAVNLPIDGISILSSGPGDAGKLQLSSLLDVVGASFVVPTSLSNVNIVVDNSANFTVGQWIYITIAGFYAVSAKPDSTHLTITNLGSLCNASAGVTILAESAILPASELSGLGGGGGGGANAYTITTASFTVPAISVPVTVTMGATGWLGGIGYIVFIKGAGYYSVNSIISSTQASLVNLGYTGNAGSGTSIANGAQVSPGGLVGATGAAGSGTNGQNAYDLTSVNFTVPAIAANISITIGNTAWLVVGQILYIAGAGSYQVASISSSSTFIGTNLNYPGNATVGTVITSGAKISPSGLIGPTTGASGLNAYTTLSSSFVQPAASATVSINVGTTAWMAGGQAIFITGGGTYTISSITDINHAVVTNLGYPTNANAGVTVASGGQVTPSGTSGTSGTSGINAYTFTTANFTTPPASSSVSVNVVIATWVSVGQVLFIAGAGYYQVAAVLTSTSLSLTNLGSTYGNTSGGATINSGATVSAAGLIGPQGATGSPGPPGAAGSGSTVYSGSSLQGNGNVATPVTLVADVAQGTNPYYVYQRNSSGNSVWAAAILSVADAISNASGGEISHIQSQTNGVAALKKLKSGATGSVTLTDNGGSTGDILVDVQVDGTTVTVVSGKLTAPGGGGGGGAPTYPSARIYDFDDFDSFFPANPTNVAIGKLGWLAKQAGSGTLTANNNQGANSTDKANGVWSFGGAASGDAYIISLGDTTNTAKNTIVPALGILTLEFRIGIAALPTGAQDVVIKFGLCAGNTSATTITSPDGIYFEYWFGNAITNWQFTTVATSTATNTTTGTAAVAGGFHKFQLLTNAGWTSIQALYDGVVKATNSAHIPTNNLCPFMQVITQGTFTPNVYIDYFFKDYQYTR